MILCVCLLLYVQCALHSLSRHNNNRFAFVCRLSCGRGSGDNLGQMNCCVKIKAVCRHTLKVEVKKVTEEIMLSLCLPEVAYKSVQIWMKNWEHCNYMALFGYAQYLCSLRMKDLLSQRSPYLIFGKKKILSKTK